jgi:hypothetical protein
MPGQSTIRTVLISFFLALLASLWGLVAPAYTGRTAREIPAKEETSSPLQTETPVHPVQRTTLAETNGPGTYFVLAIPVIVAGMPLLFRSRAVRMLSAVLLLVWVAIGIASIGLFYIPSAVVMVWSVLGKAA